MPISPLPANVGVVSVINAPVICDVMLGALGAVESKVNVIHVELDIFPAASVNNTDIPYVVSANVAEVYDQPVLVATPV